MKPYSIILSADIADDYQLIDLVKRTIPYIEGVKIHTSSLIFQGKLLLEILSSLLKDKTLILDLKIGDIGFEQNGKFNGSNAKILQQVSVIAENYSDVYVTVHGFPGPVSVKECVEVSRQLGIKTLLLPYMSHKGSEVFFNAKCGIKKVDKEIYKKYKMEFNLVYAQTVFESILGLGEQLGVDGYIGPSNNSGIIHAYRQVTNKTIVSPGFGRQSNGVPFEQQFYAWAKEVGSESAAIIGSMIYESPTPEKTAEYIKNIRDAFINDITKEEIWINEGNIKVSVIPHDYSK